MADLFADKAPGIMRDLMHDLGINVTEAAAILGNIGHECNGFKTLQEMKPTVEGSRGGYGWCQWTGPRRRAFEKWCANAGVTPESDEGNYGFLLYELRTTEKAAVGAVKNAATLDDKVKAFEMNFERAGVKHYDSRLIWARRALAAFGSAKPVPAASAVAPATPPAPAPVCEPPVVSHEPDAPAGLWGKIKGLFN